MKGNAPKKPRGPAMGNDRQFGSSSGELDGNFASDIRTSTLYERILCGDVIRRGNCRSAYALLHYVQIIFSFFVHLFFHLYTILFPIY